MSNSEDVIRKIISRALRAVNPEREVVTLVEERPDFPMKTFVRTSVSSSEHSKFYLSEAFPGWMMIDKKPLTVYDPVNA